MNVFGYCRSSTEYEAKQGNLTAQEQQIITFCNDNNHKLTKVFKDIRSAIDTRPQFDEMIKQLRTNQAEAVVVTKLDRFGRSLIDLVTTIYGLQDNKVQFISIKDNIDTTTANGKLLVHILSSFAEFEREIIQGANESRA